MLSDSASQLLFSLHRKTAATQETLVGQSKVLTGSDMLEVYSDYSSMFYTFLANFVVLGLDFCRGRLHGHPQMIRFGAHLVLALRHILTDDLKEHFREKLWFIGDLILNT